MERKTKKYTTPEPFTLFTIRRNQWELHHSGQNANYYNIRTISYWGSTDKKDSHVVSRQQLLYVIIKWIFPTTSYRSTILEAVLLSLQICWRASTTTDTINRRGEPKQTTTSDLACEQATHVVPHRPRIVFESMLWLLLLFVLGNSPLLQPQHERDICISISALGDSA